MRNKEPVKEELTDLQLKFEVKEVCLLSSVFCLLHKEY